MTDNEGKEWVKRRIEAIKDAYSVYECLMENGVDELVEEGANTQISCPFHDDKTPSARYYGTDSDPHFHCWTCKLHLDVVNLYMKYKGVNFMQGLQDLERRFNIRVPRRPESPSLPDEDALEVDRWADVPRMVNLLERKMIRIRDRTPLLDYIKYSRILDAIEWDLERIKGDPPVEMSITLNRLRSMMDASGEEL